MVSDTTVKARLLDDIIRSMVTGGYMHLTLYRDLIRCTPRRDLETTMDRLVPLLADELDEFGFDRLAEIVVELRLHRSLKALIEVAETSENEGIRALASTLESVEHDCRRWGRLVTEWPIE